MLKLWARSAEAGEPRAASAEACSERLREIALERGGQRWLSVSPRLYSIRLYKDQSIHAVVTRDVHGAAALGPRWPRGLHTPALAFVLTLATDVAISERVQ